MNVLAVEVVSNTVMWSLIVGFFAPLIIGVIIQTKWTEGAKAFVAFVVSLVLAAGTVYFENTDWNWHDFVSSALIVLVTAISTYKGLWRPTKVAPGIERSTNIT